MKVAALKAIGAVLCLVLVYGIIAAIYSTSKGYTAWYFAVSNVRMTIDGKRSSGYLHRFKGQLGQEVVLTRAGVRFRETYWLLLANNGTSSVTRCAGWIVPRLPVFAVGDVNPPCLAVGTEVPVQRNLKTGLNYVEFSGDDGERIHAAW